MKNEKFFELLGSVDDKFIEEAITEYDPNASVAVPAGKTRVSPMKIIAPIAACLALVTAAGFVVSNFDKLTKSAIPNNSTSNGETNSSAYMENSTPGAVKEFADTTFVNECKELVISQLTEKSSSYINFSNISWDAGLLDMDFDGEDEYLIYPKIRKGVFVFKKAQNEPEYIGSFGEGFNIEFNKIYKAADGGDYYYYHYLILDRDTTSGYSCEGIKLVSFEQDRIRETSGIYGDVCSRYYCGRDFKNVLTCYDGNNNKISPDDFWTLWKQYPYLPEPTITNLGHSTFAIDNAVDLLAEKYGADRAKLVENEFWFDMDINNDNITEGILMFKDVPELPDIYVIGDNGTNYMGSLCVTGKQFSQVWQDADIRYLPPGWIKQFQDGNESFFYYTTTETSIIDGEEIETAWYIYKVIVNDDNTVSGEKYLNFGRDLSNGGKAFLRLGDRDISASEFIKERNKFCKDNDHKDNDYKFAELDCEVMMETGLNFGDFYTDIKELDPKLEFITSLEVIQHIWNMPLRATLCSTKLDDYQISLRADHLFIGDIDSEPVYCAEKLFITLANKDGEVIDIVDVKPQGSFFTENFKGLTPIIKENIDDMLVAGNDNTTFDLQFFTLDSAEKMSFSIENDKLVLNS